MLEEGLSYPGWGERWTGRFIIGSALALLGVFLLPLLPLYGYLMRAMGASARGEDRPPQWSDWTGLTIEGARALAVSFVYALVPNVVGGILLVVVFSFLAGGGAVGGDSGEALAGVGLLALVVGFLVVLLVEAVVVYLLPAALLNVAAENSIGSAFDVGAVTEIAFSGAYVTALVHLLFVWFVTLVVGSILSVTGILLPAVLFWSGLVVARLFGVSYRNAMGTPAASDSVLAGTPSTAGAAGAAGAVRAATPVPGGAGPTADGVAEPDEGSWDGDEMAPEEPLAGESTDEPLAEEPAGEGLLDEEPPGEYESSDDGRSDDGDPVDWGADDGRSDDWGADDGEPDDGKTDDDGELDDGRSDAEPDDGRLDDEADDTTSTF